MLCQSEYFLSEVNGQIEEVKYSANADSGPFKTTR